MNDAASVFLRWLWDNALGAAVLCIVAALVTCLFGRKLPPAFRYALWLLVMVRLVWPVAPPAEFSLMNLSPKAPVPAINLPPVPIRPPPETAAVYIPPAQAAAWSGLPFVVWAFGASVALLVVTVRQRRLSRWAARQPHSAGERLLRIIAEARCICGTRANLKSIVVSSAVNVPAVFGLRNPVLLLPECLLNDLTDDELRLVIIHELIHVKHRDVLVNCVGVAIRSLHWFNPIAWIAWRQLCAEREHVCDAAVLGRIDSAQRSTYGKLLIKLASHTTGFIPRSLVIPILQSKPKIHRRIVMISQFKRAPVMLTSLSLFVLLIIACLTFTRAAQKAEQQSSAVATNQAPSPKIKLRRTDILAEQLARQENRVRDTQHEIDKLREELGISGAEGEAGSYAKAQTQKLESMLLEARAELNRVDLLHQLLRKLSRQELISALPTAYPDAQLAALTEQLHALQRKMAELSETHTVDHPDLKRLARVQAQLEKQLNDRLEGVMSGLQVKLKIEQARVPRKRCGPQPAARGRAIHPQTPV